MQHWYYYCQWHAALVLLPVVRKTGTTTANGTQHWYYYCMWHTAPVLLLSVASSIDTTIASGTQKLYYYCQWHIALLLLLPVATSTNTTTASGTQHWYYCQWQAALVILLPVASSTGTWKLSRCIETSKHAQRKLGHCRYMHDFQWCPTCWVWWKLVLVIHLLALGFVCVLHKSWLCFWTFQKHFKISKKIKNVKTIFFSYFKNWDFVENFVENINFFLNVEVIQNLET